MAPVRRLQLALLVPGFLAVGFQRGQVLPQEGAKIQVTTQEVLVDVVVRDKRKKLVRGLTAGDFEVLEDGVPQQIKGFRLVRSESAGPAVAQPAMPGAAPQTQRGLDPLRVHLITAVLTVPTGALGLSSFREGARALVERSLQPDTYIGLYLINPYSGARLFQPYTANRSGLLAAIDRLAAMRGPLEDSSDQVLATLNAQPSMPPLFPQQTSALLTRAGDLDSAMGDAIGEQASQRSLFGLVHLVKSLAELPGRKTVVLFSSGIQVRPEDTDIFRTLISEANRSQVTFYAIDLNSIALVAELTAARASLLQAAADSMQMQTNPSYNGNGSMGTVLESLHDFPEEYLGELAESTGGFKIMARGELDKALPRIIEDIGTHYEISYVPASGTMDGRFRKIEVKVDRHDAVVQSRSGYYALPRLPGQTLFPYELGALNALTTTPAPRAFPFHVSVLRFRSGENATLFSLGYEVAARDLRPAIDRQTKRFELRICFFSLIKNERGEVVGTVSQKAPFSGPLVDLESFTRNTIIETQPFILPPGQYTVESAVVSIEQNVASTARTSLVVPPHGPLEVSDLVLVNGLEKSSQENGRLFDPLMSELGRIRPELNPLIAARPGMKLPLYFEVYASKGLPPRIEIEIKRNGVVTGSLLPKPLPAQPEGVLPFFTELDAGELLPGSYVVHVTVHRASEVVEQSLAFDRT